MTDKALCRFHIGYVRRAPVPFHCEFACRVDRHIQLEAAFALIPMHCHETVAYQLLQLEVEFIALRRDLNLQR